MANFKNTIVAGNSARVVPDCSGSPTSLGYNLIGNDNGCGFTAATGDLVGTGASPIDPLLDPLALNAPGTTATHALQSGSPAIDAGNPATPGSGGNACEPTDQRGVARPQGAACDIGAFELGSLIVAGSVTCTLGFWKNHEGEWSNLSPGDVPAWGGGATYLDILGTAPKKGDASVILAQAFIAATLNTWADATDLANAEALLNAHPVGSGDLKAGKNADPDRAVAIALAEVLQAFNESGECFLP